MLKNLREDFRAYHLHIWLIPISLLCLSTFWLVAMYRLSHWLRCRHVRILPSMIRAVATTFFSAEISATAEIGPAFRIAHSVGIVIGGDVRAGRNFEVFSNVTLGGNNRSCDGRTMPSFGDNVTVFSGAVVLGPIQVGDDVSIGANSVVLNDVPAKAVVAGVPAKVIGMVDIAHSLLSLQGAAPREHKVTQ
jgi:serine O-acetyltransferase